MDTKETPQTKEAALNQLGLRTTRARNSVSSHLDFARVDAGRQLLKQNAFMSAVVVVVSGSANVSVDGEHLAHLEAPFVLDRFAGDDRRLATVDVVASAASTVLLIDQRHRDTVFDRVTALSHLSASTQTHIDDQTVIDVTEAVTAFIS